MKAPTHDCPVQGPDTALVRFLNTKTGKHDWLCVWCLMANKVKEQL